MTDTREAKLFSGQERKHLDTLHRRLDWLREQTVEERGESAMHHVRAEAHAIGWALDVLEGIEQPFVIRLHRLKGSMQALDRRIALMEDEMRGEDDEYDE